MTFNSSFKKAQQNFRYYLKNPNKNVQDLLNWTNHDIVVSSAMGLNERKYSQ